MKNKILIIILLLYFFLPYFYSYTNIGGTCYCSTCSDCENAIQDPACNTVTLTNDISGALNCIDVVSPITSKTLDCNRKKVSAVSIFGIPTVKAIKIDTGGGNSLEIRNCNVYTEGRGIDIDNTDNVVIENITVNGSYASVLSPAIDVFNVKKSLKINNIGVSGFREAVKADSSNNTVITNFNGSGILWKNSENGTIKSGLVLLLPQAVVLSNVKNAEISDIFVFNATPTAIEVSDSQNITIHNITAYSSETYGLRLLNNNYLTLYDLTVYDSNWTGIRIVNSPYTVLRDSTVYNNRILGVHVKDSPYSVVRDIISHDNIYIGVSIDSPNSQVYSITTYSHSSQPNSSGIGIGENTSGTEVYNIYSENNTVGAAFYSSTNATLRDSTFKNNQIGVLFSLSGGGNTLKNNKITSSSLVGIELGSLSNPSPPDLIYNNYLNNTKNADWNITVYPVYWNTSLKSGVNILGGPYIGGNLWSNPSGTDFSDTCSDADNNSICDNPYTINGVTNIDYYPLAVGSYVVYAKGNIFFVPPTPPNNTILYNRDYFEANATTNLTENYTKIVIHVYNFTSYYTNYECSSPPIKPCYTNFTSMPEGVYYLLAELYMTNFTIYQSEVRTIAITNSSLFCSP